MSITVVCHRVTCKHRSARIFYGNLALCGISNTMNGGTITVGEDGKCANWERKGKEDK